jgi:putative membrane protein
VMASRRLRSGAVLSPEARARVEDAVGRAEARTSAEFVCVVMHAAGDWRFVPLLWAALAALAVPWPLALATDWPVQVIHAVQVLAFVASWLVLRIPGASRRLVPRHVARERAHQVACEQFMVRGLSGTRGRTGILVFVALEERYACVIPDEGIAALLPADTWKRAIERLTDALKAGRTGDGLAAAVTEVADALSVHAPAGPADIDELPNRVVEL